jgi:hypothetical protein
MLPKDPLSVSLQNESPRVAENTTTKLSHRPERRQSPRGLHTEPDRVHLVALILGSYAEMPGLSLHLHQVGRLFGLRHGTCAVVLNDLVRDGRLRQSPDGQYRVANSGRL